MAAKLLQIILGYLMEKCNGLEMTSQGNNFYCIIKYFRNPKLNAWSEWKAEGLWATSSDENI